MNIKKYIKHVTALMTVLSGSLTVHLYIQSYRPNSTVNNFDQYFYSFQNYLETLSLEQLHSLSHILFLICLLISTFNLAAIFYGDSLIKYLNIENKYPSLAYFISIRRKFQQYYFGWNLFLIISVLIVLLLFNIFVFFTA